MAILTAFLAALLLLAVRLILAAHWEQLALIEAGRLDSEDFAAGRIAPEQLGARYALVPKVLTGVFDLTQWRYCSPFKAA